MASERRLRVTVWNEYRHEKENPRVSDVYPDGIHSIIADGLCEKLREGVQVRTATLDEPEHGLSEEALAQTDVLFWWGHKAHDEVRDEVVEKVRRRVLEGMGLVILHSGHYSKIFRRLMGTECMLRWREAGEKERLWVTMPGHPILQGIEGEYFELPHTEMYGEFFDVPPPDELLLISWFQGGEVFRSGMTWRRGQGKVFYFRPGHETYPIYFDRNVKTILANAAKWAGPTQGTYSFEARRIEEPLETLPKYEG
jgi:trehalose utilization protein